MTAMFWKEPPPATRGGPKGRRDAGKAYGFVQELKAQPGRWAYYGEFKSARTATQLQDVYGVDATVRKREDGKWDVYARWEES